jgi:plasmid stabilization system protein ParE
MRLKLRREATADIRDAYLWYERQNPAAARRFIDAVDDKLAEVRAGPHGFPWYREHRVRHALVPGFPYRLLFREEGEHVMLFAVAHQKRSDAAWSGRIPP